MFKNNYLHLSIILICVLILKFKVTIPVTNNSSSSYLNTIAIDNVSNFTINNNNLIYLISDSNYYELNEINLTTNKKTTLKKISKNDLSCTLEATYIKCINSQSILIYDFKFKLLFTSNINTSIIPYKDTYLKLSNNKLLLTQNHKDIIFQTLNNLNNLTLIDHFNTSNNTYLLFSGNNELSIYNINSKEHSKIKYSKYQKYEYGFYFYDDSSLAIYNLNSNNIKEYSYTFKSTVHTLNNNTIFEFNNETSTLFFTSLTDFTKKELYIPNLKVNSLIAFNNYLYLITNDFIYIIDLTQKTTLVTDERNEEDEKLLEKLTTISNAYNIQFHIKESASITYPDFTVEIENDINTINSAINKLEPVLSKFNKEFFTNFYDHNYNGLNIYLTSTLTPKNYETQVATPAAYSLINNNKYMIVIDITENNLEEILCHELMHNLEFNLEINNLISFMDWKSFNPSNFYYNNSYTSAYNFNYTISEEDRNNVYFIDNYAQTYEEEDRARIFETICTNKDISNYPNLVKKKEYLQKEILNYYPELKTASIF